MKNGRKRAGRQFLCSTPEHLLNVVLPKKTSPGFHSEKLESSSEIKLVQEEHKHLSLALRLKVGDDVTILDKELNVRYSGTIQAITKESSLIQIWSFCYVVKPNVTAIVGITDQKVLDAVTEKLTELGVDDILFFKADYSSAQNTSKEIKLDRLEKIRDGALKQCASYSNCKLSEKKDLDDAISGIESSSSLNIALFPPEGEEWVSLTHLLPQNKGVTKIVFVVGPEGGFSQREVDLLISKDFKIAGLSTNTLRVETACIVSGGIILQHLNCL